jgi:hypothetical protein
LGLRVRPYVLRDQVRAYVRQSRFTFKVVIGGGRERYTLGKGYNILAFPTNYLIDGSGRIVWRTVGFNEPALREALAKLGVQ